ncbi:MAG: dolichol monophosphate mannose synthase [Proteobacteria bacterium]|jgi:dolichol-phosphate mannosyltransferase|nr:dolichol monophosphate mannose synthase [Pseudomonadota bacterium]HSN63171.1 glycosyltransferase family 2 protein [Azonexus sp.]
MPQLSIVVPTFNETGNIAELRDRVAAALSGVDWEMIYVDDDSPDGTSATVRELAQRDNRVRCIQRIGRRGLSSACIEGMLASSAPIVAVIDADLQHDERLLPAMFDVLRDEEIDVVVGSRYTEGGSMDGWDRTRAATSRFATKLSRLVLKADLQDTMSGFFMVRRAVVERCARAGMSGVGFKILLDLFATSPTPLRCRELPYEFRNRFSGESKLDTMVAWEYFIMLLDHYFGRVVPIRFIAFSLVGLLGLVVHLLVLSLLFRGAGMSFLAAQASATMIAMTFNFVINNVLTYRDMQLRGWQWLRGWLSFTLACSVGALANVGIATYLFDQRAYWVLSAVAGVLVGAVWNYAVTAVYTWKKPKSG